MTAEEETFVRTELLERVAHELRGPAGVTLGALEELERALGDGAAGLLPLFAMARRGVRRVLHTAERLQRTALLERHDISWAFSPIDVAALVKMAIDGAELLESRRGISVVFSAPTPPRNASVDVPWVSLALSELVMNAIAHARKLVSVDARVTAAGLEIAVVDDGPGFEIAPLPRFHAPRAMRGLGLSISLVRDVVAAHGGELIIEPRSEGNPGGRVRMMLPLPR